jgi:ATP-dependent Lhr-like helicase
MISFVNIKKLPKDEKILGLFRPYVREWFKRNFKKLTLPQKFSIPLIKRRKNVLITSPTGSGKTLSCFASILNELFKLGERGKLEEKIYCLYISPLRALDNDIYRNLLVPLKEIREIAEEMKIKLPEIRVGVRTGDTLPSERQRQLKHPPHILISTPETLAILLGTRKFKENLRNVRYVIIDEIHELADSKRGVHLSLSLERLQHLTGKPFVRIGAGATLEPLIECAKFLVGYENGKIRNCKIIDARLVKKMDIKLLSPTKDLLYASGEATTLAMYHLLNKLISKHKTTLIFTNTRSGTERVVHFLKQKFPEVYSDEEIGAHHSSVSREIRHEVEDKLKKGRLKVCVSSTSLELGIDIGNITQVIQLGSPKSITRLVQRIGRGGHTIDKTSVGRVIAMDRDDQVELAVMIQQAYKYFLDKIQIPQNCLDVLAQHLMGMSLEQKWNVKKAFNLIRNSYCYHNLDWDAFISVLEFLSGAYHSLEERKVYGKIWWDNSNGMFGRRGKYARVIYSLNIGTIPDEVKIKVKTLDGRYIGSIEEGFLQRLMPGDIFVLAGKTYEFKRARQVTAYVVPARRRRPTVPAWFSEMLPLSFELALKIQEFRGKMFKLMKRKKKREIIKWLLKNYHLDKWSANSIYQYFLWEYRFLKSLGAKRFPNKKTILIENYIDERGNQNIIFHTLFGRRVNDVLSRTFGYLLTKKLKKSIGLTISDNGFVISIPSEPIGKGWLDITTLKSRIKRKELERTDPRNLVKLLKSSELEKVLRKALRQTEIIKRRFRHCAVRSLMILRNYKGYEIRVAKQQLNADRLLKVCEKFENFPVVEETYREVTQDFMNIEHAKQVLEQIEKGKIRYEFLPESNVPSPFAHNLIILGESDIVLMEDRKRLLVELHKKVIEKVD